MKPIVPLLTLAIASCANSPTKPATYTTPEGDNWVMSYRSSPVSGSTHLYINGKLVASGSFGLAVGNNATGTGKFLGSEIFFSCVSRYTPVCTVYVDGKEAATMELDPRPPAQKPGAN